jgi:hypothetical protein
LELYQRGLSDASRTSPSANFLAYVGQIVYANCDPQVRWQYWFETQIGVLVKATGPFNDLYLTPTLLSVDASNNNSALQKAQIKALEGYRISKTVSLDTPSKSQRIIDEARESLTNITETRQMRRLRGLFGQARRDPHSARGMWRAIRSADSRFILDEQHDELIREIFEIIQNHPSEYTNKIAFQWNEAINTLEVFSRFADILTISFELEPSDLWTQALRAKLFGASLEKLPRFTSSELARLEIAFSENNYSKTDLLGAASFLLYDIWLFCFGTESKNWESPIDNLLVLTSNIDEPAFNAAREIRSLALISARPYSK